MVESYTNFIKYLSCSSYNPRNVRNVCVGSCTIDLCALAVKHVTRCTRIRQIASGDWFQGISGLIAKTHLTPNLWRIAHRRVGMWLIIKHCEMELKSNIYINQLQLIYFLYYYNSIVGILTYSNKPDIFTQSNNKSSRLTYVVKKGLTKREGRCKNLI